MAAKKDWNKLIQPLLRKYKNKKHPLNYQNVYQLMVMVVLSARSSDAYINQIAPALFNAYPDFRTIASDPDGLYPFIKGVPGGLKKSEWLISIANQLKENKVSFNMDALTQLSGIGRKSANVIMRETGASAAGIVVDLHVVRVAPRIGIAKGTNPEKIEQQLMQEIDQKYWGDTGMALSFLGRDTCRPRPQCPECVMQSDCAFYTKGGYQKIIQLEMKAKAAKAKQAMLKKARRK